MFQKFRMAGTNPDANGTLKTVFELDVDAGAALNYVFEKYKKHFCERDTIRSENE